MKTFWQDVSYGLRALRKQKSFALVAIGSLALGIAANSAVFSVMNAVLLKPLPYPDADRLVILWSRSPGMNVEQDWFSPGQYLDVKTQNQVFEQTAITIGASFNMTGQGVPEHIDGARVSSSFFQLFGANAALGRIFTAEEDSPGKPAAVVLSHSFWQRRYGGDQSALNQSLVLNGNTFAIVGVLSSDFTLTNDVMPAVNAIGRADVFLPLTMSDAARSNRGNEDFNIFGKLKPGVSQQQAQADMDLIAARMKQDFPQNYPPTGGLTISVVPLLEQVVGDVGATLPILMSAVGFVLLIACANVANLLLARASGRQKEIAVRVAVGASRWRIVRQLLTESVLLASVGGIIGLAVAFASVGLLRSFGPQNIPRLHEVGIDWRVAAFTVVVTFVTGIVFGLVPALRASQVDLHETLKDGGRSASGASGRTAQRLRKLLVVAEIALSLVLLICAALLIRSYQRILNSHPGFDPNNVVAMRLALPQVKAPTPEAILSFYQRVTDRIRSLPGVEAAGVSHSLPMSTVSFAWDPITVEGYVPRTPDEKIMSNIRMVSPDFFRAMRTPLRQGRFFDERDKRGEPETVIINEALAERFWPNQDPLGKRLQQTRTKIWRTVVGVVRDAKQFQTEKEPPLSVYFPFEQSLARNLHLVVRTTSDPVAMTPTIVGALQSVDAEMPAFDVATMEQRMSDFLARRRFAMVLLAVFAAIAVLLAAVGIYGVMSYSVTQRTNEIGIRVALGASSRDVLNLILRQGMTLALIGAALGLVVAFGLTRFLSSMLFGIRATDPMTFARVALLLIAVALLACWIPARRATKVDPMIALRCE
ncbi:MAG: ABC transporter permease [Acidobacteriota bacterium]|nr:ABC transporter permease [Acidobacteriota bacterium]